MLPPYISKEKVLALLPVIFPLGTPNRNNVTRDSAAKTIFTMLYIGAVEGANTYLAPVYVYRMTDEYELKSSDTDRIKYKEGFLKKGFKPPGTRWYADNTREQIRDDSIREGLIPLGAILELKTVATTSSKPRYFLQKEFSQLFDPDLMDEELENAIVAWRGKYLSKSALTRTALANQQNKPSDGKVSIIFPNGDTRSITHGKSSIISKAVIEDFARKFLEDPVVLWLSTSADKVVASDDKLASSIGLKIQADKNLPDIILVDIKPQDPLIVFIEVVATDGAITSRRKEAIWELTDSAGFSRLQVMFVTAYLDRHSPGFKKTFRDLAWNTFAWFVSESDNIIHLKDGASYLSKLGNIDLKK